MSREPDQVKRFWGGALMGIGGLIAGLCGTCTLWGLSTLIGELGAEGDAGVYARLFAIGALLIGGLPTAIGLLVFWAGWRRYNVRPRIPPAKIAVFSDEEDPR